MSPNSANAGCSPAPATRVGRSRVSQRYLWTRFLRERQSRQNATWRREAFTLGAFYALCALAIGTTATPSSLIAESAPGAAFAQPAVLTRPFASQAQPATFVLAALSLTQALAGLAGLAAASTLLLMFPSGNGGGGGHAGRGRTPPAWSPEREATYPFRHWMQDLLAWSVLSTDMDPAQQAAAIVLQLGGTARDLARNLSYEELTRGGTANGQTVDPVTYLLTHLATNFAPLGEEARVSALTDIMNFGRRPGESIDGLLSRFMAVRHRAASGGAGMVMNWEGMSFTLLRACGVNNQQFMQLLQPFQHRFPNNEAEFQSLQLTLRRMGHVLENHPGNIASRLRTMAPRQMFAGVGWDNHDATAAMEVDPASLEQDPWHAGPDPWQASAPVGPIATTWHNPPAATDPHQGAHPAAYHQRTDAEDSGTDTDTVSDDGGYNAAEDAEIADMTPAQIDEHIFWQYQQAKSRWRRHMNKPTRRVRRFVKRKGKGRKGSGKHRGKGRFAFLADMTDEEQDVFFGRKGKGGKGKGRRTSGKGKGRRRNPIGRDGEVMRCSICNSDTHFRRECPQGDGQGNIATYTTADVDPLAGVPTALTFMTNGHEAGPSGTTPAPAAPAVAGSSTGSSWHEPRLTAASLEALRAHHAAIPPPPQPVWPAPGGMGAATPPWWDPGAFAPPGPSQQIPVTTGLPPAAGLPPDGGPAEWPRGNPTPYTAGFADVPQWTPQARQQAANPPASSHQPATASTTPWPRTVDLANTLWEQAVPRPTAPLHDEQLTRPEAVLPELAGFRQIHERRQDQLRREAQDDPPQASPVIRQQAAGATPLGLPGISTTVLNTIPGELQVAAGNMASLQAATASQTAQERDRRRHRAIRRLAAAMAAGYADDSDPEEGPATAPGTAGTEAQRPLCSICQEVVLPGMQMATPACAHSFHAQCLNEWVAHHVATGTTAPCPLCRGSMADPRIHTVERTPPPTPPGPVETHHLGTPDSQRTFQSVGSVLPWWPQQEDHPDTTQVYSHSATQLPNKLSVIVDCGAWTNLIGESLARRVAERSARAGHQTKSSKMDQPLSIQGVGDGSQRCTWQCTCPVAVPHADGTTGAGTFTAPIVRGAGHNLPALLGLRSLEQQRAIIDTAGRTLILPGPGDVEISLPPGSVRVPLEKAPSGHLVMVIDDYENLTPSRGGLASRQTHFLAETGPADPDRTANPTTVFRTASGADPSA